MITATIIAMAALGQVAYHGTDTTRLAGDLSVSLYDHCISERTADPAKIRTLDVFHDADAKLVRAILRIDDDYTDVMSGEFVDGFGFVLGSWRGSDGHTLRAEWLPTGGGQWLVSWDEIIRDPEEWEHLDCLYGMNLPPLASTTRQVGDTTLDGIFDSSDLIAVFTAGQYEDGLPLNSRWADGDWNADGEFDSGDLVAALQTGKYEQPNAAHQVPEPAKISGLILAALLAFRRRPTSLDTRLSELS